MKCFSGKRIIFPLISNVKDDQYEKTVKPMYDQFVKPSRDLADIIITDGVQNKEAIDALMSNINVLL